MFALVLLAAERVVTLKPEAVAALAGTVLPLIVRYANQLTPGNWSSRAKAVLLALVAIVTGVLASATQASGVAVISLHTVLDAVIAYVAGQAAFNGLWRNALPPSAKP